jgi:hypothetical protein
MTVIVASVSTETKNEIRSKITEGNLIYVAKVKIVVALPNPKDWTELFIGYLSLSSTNDRAFLSVYDCDDYRLLMIHELYYHFDEKFTKLSPTLFAFPSDRCMIGIQFLIESEGFDMQKLIRSATPRKRRALRHLFRKISAGRDEQIVVSMPQVSEPDTGMRWDHEQGYVGLGDVQALPEEHKQFIQGQRRRSNSE